MLKVIGWIVSRTVVITAILMTLFYLAGLGFGMGWSTAVSIFG